MRYALTSEQMRLAEERAVSATGATMRDLMERAARAVASAAMEMAPDGHLLVLAGKGNNGGDGWAAARLLLAAGRAVSVVAPGGLPAASPGDAAANDALAAGVVWIDGVPADLTQRLADAALVIDALFGAGFSGTAREPFSSVIQGLNESGARVLAVDLPSGVDADTGGTQGPAVTAVLTIALAAPKLGSVIGEGRSRAGRLAVADIGVPVEFLGEDGDPEVWDDADLRSLVPLPRPDAYKNSRGRVLVIAGSGAFPGAAALAAMGAQRAGAGYVTLAVPESVADTANAALQSVVVAPQAENVSRTFASKAGDTLLDLAADHDAVVLGPGLTLAHGAVLLVRTLVTRIERPLLVDADGLNALVDATGLLRARRAATVVTPHPGELSRLVGASVPEIQGDRLSYGSRLAEGPVTCVLKGAGTVIAGGGRLAVDPVGTVALAHAGTGDVLAGVLGTLLAQGLNGFDAGVLGTALHGWAGRLAAEAGSELAVTAEDVAGCLPGALKRLSGR